MSLSKQEMNGMILGLMESATERDLRKSLLGLALTAPEQVLRDLFRAIAAWDGPKQ